MSIKLTEIPEILRSDEARAKEREAELWKLLVRDDFTGHRYETAVMALHRYTESVLRSWLTSGMIFAEVTRIGRPVQGFGEMRPTREEKEDLIALTLDHTCEFFLKHAKKPDKAWRPGGGRRLRSFFVAAMIYSFNNAFKQWRRSTEKWRSHTSVMDSEPAAREDTQDINDIDDVLLDMGYDEIVRAILADRVDGYTCDEIAKRRGLSRKAVEGRLARAKVTLKANLQARLRRGAK